GDHRDLHSFPTRRSSDLVLSNRMGGFAMEAQSSLRPRRTTMALVKAANSMVLAASMTNRPVNDARRKAPRPSKASPPPPPQPPSTGGGGGPCMTSRVIDPDMPIEIL